MASFVSPRDPVFWLHHARVDELWVRWNLLDEKPNTNHTDWTNTEFTEFCDRAGNPTSVQVSLTTLYPLLSYRYDTQEVV
jgi:tyrosinase